MGGMATGCVPLASCLGAEGGGVDNLRSSSVEAAPRMQSPTSMTINKRSQTQALSQWIHTPLQKLLSFRDISSCRIYKNIVIANIG